MEKLSEEEADGFCSIDLQIFWVGIQNIYLGYYSARQLSFLMLFQ